MKIPLYIFTICLTVIFLPFLAHAQTLDLDEQGMIDEGGIMTGREQEQTEVRKAFFEQERKKVRKEYWIRVGGVVLAALLVFEVGIRMESSKSKKETDRVRK